MIRRRSWDRRARRRIAKKEKGAVVVVRIVVVRIRIAKKEKGAVVVVRIVVVRMMVEET